MNDQVIEYSVNEFSTRLLDTLKGKMTCLQRGADVEQPLGISCGSAIDVNARKTLGVFPANNPVYLTGVPRRSLGNRGGRRTLRGVTFICIMSSSPSSRTYGWSINEGIDVVVAVAGSYKFGMGSSSIGINFTLEYTKLWTPSNYAL